MNKSIFRIIRQRKSISNYLTYVIRSHSTETEEIIIPKRIERGPTDILRALSQTVQNDPTAPHYKFHDDPYLIPYSNRTKRSYALSQEAGRKAAHWIRQEHADLFQHKVAEPPVEVFSPKPVFDEDSNMSEDDLQKAIKNIWVLDAINIHKMLMKKGIDVSHDTTQSLLELVCYYNCQDTLSEDWIEERWLRSSRKWKQVIKKTWKDGGFAEQIFNSMKPADSKAYSAIISGMCLYGQLDTASKLYQESIQKNISLNVGTFNALISRVNFMRQSHGLMWDLIEELLNTMNQRRLKPNLGTLNAVLESLSVMYANRSTKTNALRILAEFKALGIEPSLASFYHLLNIFCKEKRPSCGILIDILNYIDFKEFHAADVNDNLFFMRAMEVCYAHLHDGNVAKRLDRLLHTGDNYNLIGDSYRESNYYRFFFTLLCETEPIDEFMIFYEKLVPSIYMPEPSVMMAILNSIEMNTAWNYLPKIWSDMVSFDHLDRENLVEKMLQCCAANMDELLRDQMLNIGWNIWEKIEDQKKDRNLIQWSGKMLGNLMMIFLTGHDKEKVEIIFNKLQKSQSSILGEPDILPLQLFLDSCIEDSLVDLAIKCVSYCNEIGFLETEGMARKLYSCCSLSHKQLENLKNIVGEKVLKNEPK